MESLREPVYKNYSSGRKRETFSDAYAAPETAALNLPAAPELGRAGDKGTPAATSSLPQLHVALYGPLPWG